MFVIERFPLRRVSPSREASERVLDSVGIFTDGSTVQVEPRWAVGLVTSPQVRFDDLDVEGEGGDDIVRVGAPILVLEFFVFVFGIRVVERGL